ncbi:response regulator transcription factor [Kiritimatiellota bacterium B12222]|nr:response regulator transcription factor [Kiritimatiellota bacterium B12222]
MKVLIIEDSSSLQHALTHGLQRCGYTVESAMDGEEGFLFARHHRFDVIILDLLLPGMDGLTLLKKLRALGNQTHVLILSAKDQVSDRVEGLRLGADDYLVKPFSFEELHARIATLVRRGHQNKNPDLHMGQLRINTFEKQAYLYDQVLKLTPGEYAILERLALSPGQVFSKEQLATFLQNSENEAGSKVVEVLVCTLRKKLGSESARVVTRRGFGYFLEKQ